MRRNLLLLPALLAGLLAASPTRAASGTVNVMYAASLANLNETLIGPAFATGTGYTYQGKAAGSLAIATQIKGRLATPDAIELADPRVNATLEGEANGNIVSWYFTFARTSLVIGYDPRGPRAAAFRAVRRHTLPWYRALLQPRLRLGRTDPNLDPKGYRALFMARLAGKEYHLKRFKQRVLGSDGNPAQVFPEEVLVSRMLTGQLDAAVFYLSEAKALGIPYIALPARINFGSLRYRRLYATQHFTTTQGVTITGAPIEFTITIPTTVRNEPGAEAFVRFVLSKRVRGIAARNGLLPVKTMVGGDRQAVPGSLVRFIGQS